MTTPSRFVRPHSNSANPPRCSWLPLCLLEPLEPRRLLAFTPDLIATSVDVNDTSYNVGNFIQATVHISNVGDALSNTGSFTLKYYLGKTGNLTYRFIESGNVVNVFAGIPTSDVINVPGYQIPQDVPEGTYFIHVVLDTGNDVAESNESNNTKNSASFTIHQPDLVVTSVTDVDTTGYGVGQFLHATAAIKNQGQGSTLGPFSLRFYLGTSDGTNKTLYTIEDGSVLFLNGGQSTTDIINGLGWQIPNSVPEGNYRVWVQVDPANDIPENNEANNFGSSAAFHIYRPDLQVPSVSLSGTAFDYGDFLKATATISNTGAATAGPSSLSFYLGTPDGSNKQQYFIENGSVLFLNGGDSTTDVINGLGWLIPPTVQPGAYRVWVLADSGSDVPELDESNNWGSSGILYLQGARWEDLFGNILGSSIAEATPLYLSLTANNVSHSTVFTANIYEDDILSNDLLKANVQLTWDSGNTWRARWVPYRTSDGIGGGDPEYFFRINNPPSGLLFTGSSDLTVTPHAGDFGVELFHHTLGTGVPLVLVHGNNSDVAFDLYRWKGFSDFIEAHPASFAEFDVYLWKHDTSLPIGFNGAPGTIADNLAKYIYGTLHVGQPGSPYEHTKVALVAHSQGGMVSRSFMNYFNPTLGHLQGDDVSGLVTLDTPNLGSPFAIQDWVAALWAQVFGTNAAAEDGFNALLAKKVIESKTGALNLAWDNSDGVLKSAFVTAFPNSTYTLTPRDTNMLSSFPDPSVVFTDAIKNSYGTLSALNNAEVFYDKLVTIGAYDNSLADNTSPADFAASVLGDFGFSDHTKLSAVTVLLSKMSSSLAGNTNPSNYFANDGLVPLQSSLLLNLPSTGIPIASIDSALSVTIDRPLINSLLHQDQTAYIFSNPDGIIDHEDILDTLNQSYWQTITNELRKLIDSAPPTAALLSPVPGLPVLASQLNSQHYLDISFTDSSSGIDPRSITDAAAEFSLSGSGAAGVTLNGAPTRIGSSTYRYSFTGSFAPGTVNLTFIPGTFADDSGNANTSTAFQFTLTTRAVVNRALFYNNSGFDGADPAANSADDAAIDPSKLPLLPGQSASFANYSSYDKGINGIMIDIPNTASTPTPADFLFKVGNSADPSTWSTGPAPAAMTRRVGAGLNGSDRITLTWPDHAIENKWLQVTVLATAATNIAAPDTFYFGNAIADSGNSPTNASVTAVDQIAARANPGPAPIDDAFDFNRDLTVDSADELLARQFPTSIFNSLKLISVPAAAAPAFSLAASTSSPITPLPAALAAPLSISAPSAVRPSIQSPLSAPPHTHTIALSKLPPWPAFQRHHLSLPLSFSPLVLPSDPYLVSASLRIRRTI